LFQRSASRPVGRYNGDHADYTIIDDTHQAIDVFGILSNRPVNTRAIIEILFKRILEAAIIGQLTPKDS
jgi:hypothetical protein